MDSKQRCSVGEVWTYHKTVFRRRAHLLWKNGWARGAFVTSVALLLGVLAVGPFVGWEVTFGELSEFSINLYTVIGTLAVVVFLSAIVAWLWAPAEIDKSQRNYISELELPPRSITKALSVIYESQSKLDRVLQGLSPRVWNHQKQWEMVGRIEELVHGTIDDIREHAPNHADRIDIVDFSTQETVQEMRICAEKFKKQLADLEQELKSRH